MPFCASILQLLDFGIVCIFMTPLVVCYWQATWLLMDNYILSDSRLDSALLSTGLGIIFSHFILATQAWIVNKLSNYNKNYLHLAWKICIYLTSIFSISFWRGVWMLMDMFAGFDLTVSLVSHGMAFIFLTILRTTSSIVFCPGYLLQDQTVSPSTSFNFNPMLSLSCVKNKSVKMYFSHFQTVFFISPMTVCYWRGTWNLCVYLANITVGTGLPTCIANVSFGYIFCLLCFLISRPLEKKLTGESLAWPYFVKAFIEHVFIYVLGFASVNVWSALWTLADHYLVIPGQENNHLSGLLKHYVSFIALYLAQGTINLVGTPAGCRSHGSNTLEGLFMGTYFIFSRPSGSVTGNRVAVTKTSIKRKKSDINAPHSEGNVIGNGSNTAGHELNQNVEESNATHTEGKIIGSETNTIHNELNQNDEESNATHTEGKIIGSETNTIHNELNQNDEESNTTHTEGKIIGSETNTIHNELNQNDEESNATHTEGKIIGSETNTIHNELNQNDEESNTAHTRGNVEESSSRKINKNAKSDEVNLMVTATVPQ